MYDYVTKHDESLDYLLEQIYGYGKTEYDDMFKDSGMDNKQKVLLIDPALASRFEEFVDFVKKEEINSDKLEIYDTESATFGYKTLVYEALKLIKKGVSLQELKNEIDYRINNKSSCFK